MDKRNWLSLDRKLVDRWDMAYSFDSVQAALGQAALSYWGEGVLVTTKYPNPFPITPSGSVLGGTVGTGIAIDPNGQIVEVTATPDESTSFVAAAADPTNARWDLLVISYLMVGDTPIPKPSDPISTIDLNLHDDFVISVVEGAPGVTPQYPAKLAGQVILAGMRIPAGATNGTQIVFDYSVRELAQQAVFQNPSIIHEQPAGAVPGNTFTLSQTPLNAGSLLLILDGRVLLPQDFSIAGKVITLTAAAAQIPDAWYVWDNPMSVNPLSGLHEVPQNAGDNKTFILSGRVGNKNSVLFFVDGQPLLTSDFTVVSGPATDSIVLTDALAPGQVYSVFYLVNPASIGLSGGAGGGGVGSITGANNLGTGEGVFAQAAGSMLEFLSLVAGSGVSITPDGMGGLVIAATGGGGSAREVHGSAAAPIAVDPTVGIVPTAADDQVWWIAPSSGTGQVPITATPPIAPGSVIGQVLKIKSVASSNYLRVPEASGVDQDGDLDMGPYAQTGTYSWDGTNWSEDSRRV